MAIWVVLAYSQHPDVADVISTNGNPQDSADRELAELFSELLLERCPEEAKAAIKSDGNLAMEAAFQVLGQVAGQELANNPQVNSAMTGFTRYLDHKRLNTFFN
ncbi:hypothetical protein [Leisingera methylohalidivorans]|uniref:hypothetical protein n=1 Tax=Leisingera methylohalidivorans TaxID=133924 RepID=UPI0012EBB665|nr:hypothetical protein [Leisingera methylohalidivorans]